MLLCCSRVRVSVVYMAPRCLRRCRVMFTVHVVIRYDVNHESASYSKRAQRWIYRPRRPQGAPGWRIHVHN